MFGVVQHVVAYAAKQKSCDRVVSAASHDYQVIVSLFGDIEYFPSRVS